MSLRLITLLDGEALLLAGTVMVLFEMFFNFQAADGDIEHTGDETNEMMAVILLSLIPI